MATCCRFCLERFAQKKSLQNHVRSIRGRFVVEMSDAEFELPEPVLGDAQRVMCLVCDKIVSKRHIADHIDKEHSWLGEHRKSWYITGDSKQGKELGQDSACLLDSVDH